MQIGWSPSQAALLGEHCKKWYKLNRKARRQAGWLQLFKDLFRAIFPEVPYGQLLIAEHDMFEHFQLFFSSAVACHQSPQGEIVQENPAVDFLFCLEGLLEYTSPQDSRHEWRAGQVVALPRPNAFKNQRVTLSVGQECAFLRVQRKLMEKFKNDLLRQDRQTKESFMSGFLFCNFTPVYYISNVSVIAVKENHEVELKNTLIYLLYQGLIKRRSKSSAEAARGWTQLTKGCIINCKTLSGLVDRKDLFMQQEHYEAKVDCIVISFEVQEMARILKLNLNLKRLLEGKLKTIAEERTQLCKKSTQIRQRFNQRAKMEQEAVEIHYSVQFKPRQVKSAGGPRSFRRTKMDNADCDYGEFITFDKYDKMIESKERVALTKHGYVNRERRRRERPIYTPDYEKKLKMQNKMLKIQTGKIQKISQRDSKKECNVQQLEEIKKNLFQVTHLFDEPLQPPIVPETPKTLEKRAKTFNNLALAQYRNPRVSNLKPQQYLKNEYFTEYNTKCRYSLKDLELVKQESNKENPLFMTATVFPKKPPHPRLILNEVQ